MPEFVGLYGPCTNACLLYILPYIYVNRLADREERAASRGVGTGARGSGAGLPPRVPGSQKAEPLTVRCDGGMARGICDIPVGVPVRLRADPVLPVVELPDEVQAGEEKEARG